MILWWWCRWSPPPPRRARAPLPRQRHAPAPNDRVDLEVRLTLELGVVPRNGYYAYEITIENRGNLESESMKLRIRYDPGQVRAVDFPRQGDRRDWYTNESEPGKAVIEFFDIPGRSTRTARLIMQVQPWVSNGTRVWSRGYYYQQGGDEGTERTTSEVTIRVEGDYNP
ncbi:MAG: hypothetical protein HC914_20600 [Chloroflexaceae bacterium]|nr:hypothetical protein [Chloroflexaceae bacterium]